MWRRLYHDHHLLGAQKDTTPRRRWFKPSHLRPFLRRCLSLLLLFALLSLSFPSASLQDEPSEPTYDELIAILGEEDPSSMTVDDAAWDALLGVMGKWTDFLIYHAYDPTQHPWLNRLQTLGKLLSLRTLAQAGLVFSEGNGEEVDCSFLPPEAEHFNQVSQTLDEAAWATLEQLILIGMASHRQTSLLLPAGNGYLVQILRPNHDGSLPPPSGDDGGSSAASGDDSGLTPGGGEESSSNPSSPSLYSATWLVIDPQGNPVETAYRLMDISEWIEPQVLITWDTLIPTPAELCDCQNDFSFGEEQDDGSYLADEWYFSLYMEWGWRPTKGLLAGNGDGFEGRGCRRCPIQSHPCA